MSSILSLIEAVFMAFVGLACAILGGAFQRQDELFERDYGRDSFASNPYFYDGDFFYDADGIHTVYDPPSSNNYDSYDPYDLDSEYW